MGQNKIVVKPKKEKLWHSLDFCIAHFKSCKKNIYAIVYNHEAGYFQYTGTYGACAVLPTGWASAEILVHTAEFTNSVPGHYKMKWGFAVYLGPKEEIKKLVELEKQRTASQKAVFGFLQSANNHLGKIQSNCRAGWCDSPTPL